MNARTRARGRTDTAQIVQGTRCDARQYAYKGARPYAYKALRVRRAVVHAHTHAHLGELLVVDLAVLVDVGELERLRHLLLRQRVACVCVCVTYRDRRRYRA